MAETIPPDEQSNYETFRECLSEPVLRALAAPVDKPKKKRRARHRKKDSKDSKVETPEKSATNGTSEAEGDQEANDAEDLGEFIDYLSTLLFTSLPPPLRTLTHSLFKSSTPLQTTYSLPLSTTTANHLLSTTSPLAISNLEAYALLPSPSDTTDLSNFLLPVISSYVETATAPPPIWSLTRADVEGCELCGREWIPLTYHHLIPKSTHDRVLKRGWHTEDRLNSVAWLCRACHSFVHRVAGNEELARWYWSVELLGQREDVKGWVKWVGRVRWKAR